ncbi:MAG: transcription-repair coupling factor [Deltaproteobacteria bacterium]|nr:transcription-repair coupling factor [Deltaproteobacteria bacterium]MBW2069955.1 transcription-repair coupling factor [Deltaproteobacteria bacterium]
MSLPTRRQEEQEWKPLVGGARLHDLYTLIEGGARQIDLQGLTEWSLAYVLSRLLARIKRTILLLTSTSRQASQIHQSLSFFLGLPEQWSADPLECPLWHFPAARQLMAREPMVAPAIQAQRLAALYVSAASGAAKILVAPAAAVMEKVLPKQDCMAASRYLVLGESVDRQDLISHLVTCGYYRTELVEAVGDFSVRGDIIDLFTPLYHQPIRLEFFDETLESIRLFNPGSQRSLAVLEDVILIPAHEVILTAENEQRARPQLSRIQREAAEGRSRLDSWLSRAVRGQHYPGIDRLLPLYYQQLESLFHYLPGSAVVVLSNPGAIAREVRDRFAEAERKHDEDLFQGGWLLPADSHLLKPEELHEFCERYPQIRQGGLPVEDHSPQPRRKTLRFLVEDHDSLRQEIASHSERQRLLEPLARRLLLWQKSGISPFLICRTAEQARRVQELLTDYGVDATFSSHKFTELSFHAPVTKILLGDFPRGFLWADEGLAVVTETELYGDKQRRRRLSHPAAGRPVDSFAELQPGDYVVHLDHGIGVYQGLVHLKVDGLANDFLFLEYQDGDRLYLPVDRLNRVHRYIGIDGHHVRVDKLGDRRWTATRKKVQKSIQEMARELLQIYAERQLKEGTRFSPPDTIFREFEASFPHEETADQAAAINDVLADMQSSQCMDRLICGDVGFGKTEVALRAAFKAVMDGKQVALLVPTTVLAEQHFLTFKERLDGYPVFLDVLSRFKSRAAQQKILADLRQGRIDIIIGTHRLLQDDVLFRDLGLLIIDEEHRFGVRHKEKLKKLRSQVDVLTLTATPIPRTLHMSLVGIRNLSTIDTAPEDRRAIVTRICAFDDAVIRDGILHEKKRGGQVFFVHNNVKTIYRMANHIKELVPEATVAVAHGQMRERDLERVMLDFVRQRLDVLVCTTIIESGLDIPAANTIFINRADKFGLAQIYQLRGRVGRSSEQAYAYLLVPGEHLLTRQAQRRLTALMDFTELGSGFKIALNDLQIRGAGNILGAAQSGHIAAVGYEMYVHLMEKTIAELKGEQLIEPVEPEIHLNISAHLPASYIEDGRQRLLMYRRLAAAHDEASLQSMQEELVDRFGPLPQEAKHLLAVLELKVLLRKLWVKRLDAADGFFTLSFVEDPDIDVGKLVQLAATEPERFRLSTDFRLRVKTSCGEVEQSLAELKKLLQKLQ